MNYLSVIKNAATRRAELFGVMARALFAVSEQELFKPEFPTIGKWLEGNNVEISRATFFRMRQLGLMLQYVEISDKDLASVGEASMYELARLGQSHELATKFWQSGDIPRLINARISGDIPTVAALKAEVDALLGKAPKGEKEPEGEGSGEGESTDKGDEWKEKYKALVARMRQLAPKYQADRFVIDVLRGV